MEVHHHSSPAPGGSHTPRKKWTHYFWEFLMLFLAVFCGFLAEYKLEHTIEHQREKKIAGFIEKMFTNELVFYAHHIKITDDISLNLFQNNILVEQKRLIDELKKEYPLK